MNWNLEGKWILITGCTSGIGETVSYMLDSYGANTVLVGRNTEKLQKMEAELKHEVISISYDLMDLDNIEDIFKTCLKKGVKLDGMVYSAGISIDIPIKALKISDIENPMRIHYEAFTLFGKQFAKKKYSNDNSSIVVLSSAAAFTCDKGMMGYAASKAAINAAVQVMSKEFVQRRIRVNAVAPCFVDTDMTWNVAKFVDDFQEKINTVQPFGVIPKEQIAFLIFYLLSDYSSYITGDVIPVTGGQII